MAIQSQELIVLRRSKQASIRLLAEGYNKCLDRNMFWDLHLISAHPLADWEYIGQFGGDCSEVHVFTMANDKIAFVISQTDELVSVYPIHSINKEHTVPNLMWALHLAYTSHYENLRFNVKMTGWD